MDSSPPSPAADSASSSPPMTSLGESTPLATPMDGMNSSASDLVSLQPPAVLDSAGSFDLDEDGKDADEREETWEEKRTKLPKAVQIDYLDFERFKNRYYPEQGLAIIEVLHGHEHLAQEVVKERLRRSRPRRYDQSYVKSTGDGGSKWMQRVRIQSPEILLLLSRLTGHHDNWPVTKPRVFFPPFRAFYYTLPSMKKCLELLEERWAKAYAAGDRSPATAEPKPGQEVEKDKADSDSDSDSSSEDDGKPAEPDVAVAGLADTVTALQHVRKYVRFVEQDIMPSWKRAAGTSQRKMRFLDLWMSFQPGELLYVSPAPDSTQNSEAPKSTTRKMYQSAWRLCSMVLDPIRDDYPNDITSDTRAIELDIYAYYIDYDGSSYGPVEHKFTIKHYEGEKDITTLEIYPMRFLRDCKKIKASLRDQGTFFLEVVKKKHVFYDGWTLTHGPTEESSSTKSDNAEHIDGDVIIDFDEGFRADSSLSPPSFSILNEFDDSSWPRGVDQLPVRYWTSGPKSVILGEVKDTLQRGEWFCQSMRKKHEEENVFYKAHKEVGIHSLEGDDLILLPRRLVAYAFRERKFAMLDIRALDVVPETNNAFRDLKIDENHKLMVTSLVKSHFEKQRLQKSQPMSRVGLNQDLIRGKGSGLVILLHGVPGVGKTTTAEAIAQAYKRPLFSITCGDLGSTPREVEAALRGIFRLAHLWDCVLLLDEADIFLSRREVSDLNRNALVSVFLRVLEYFSGAMFLTTNRVGALDEAFKSRVHISLYYPPLSLYQTLEIFKVNLNKLREIEADKQNLKRPDGTPVWKRSLLKIDDLTVLDYAKFHFRTHEPHERWNGRQIRNAFQIAYSLAHYDIRRGSTDQSDVDDSPHETGDGKVVAAPLLDYRQFEIVAGAIDKFDKYLYDAVAGNAADTARNLGLRADDHDPYKQPSGYRYQPPSRARRPSYTPSHLDDPEVLRRRRTDLLGDEPEDEDSPTRRRTNGRRQENPPAQTEPQQERRQRPLMQGRPKFKSDQRENGRSLQASLAPQGPDRNRQPAKRRDERDGYDGWNLPKKQQPEPVTDDDGYFDDEVHDDKYDRAGGPDYESEEADPGYRPVRRY